MKVNENVEIVRNIMFNHMLETTPEDSIFVNPMSDGFDMYVDKGFWYFVCEFDGANNTCVLADGIHDARRLVMLLRLLGFKVKR